MDRKLIKRQAKGLLRGNVWKLFVISLVTVLLVPFLQAAVSMAAESVVVRTVVQQEQTDPYGGEDAYDFYNFGNDDAFDPYYFDDFGSRIGALPVYSDNGGLYSDAYGYFDDGDQGSFSAEDDDWAEYFGLDPDDDYGYFDDYGYDDGYGGYGLYPGDGYDSNGAFENRNDPTQSVTFTLNLLFAWLAGLVLGIAALVLLPVRTTEAGYYVQTIRGRRPSIGTDIGYIYKTAFQTAYFKKLGLELLTALAVAAAAFAAALPCGIAAVVLFAVPQLPNLGILFTAAASICALIPGVLLSLRWAFARQILCDNPEMDILDAMRLSGKMTKGHCGELFTLWLSFLGWFLLGAVTLGLAYIYIYPYFSTTMALYYQNFKIRALQTNAIDPQAFMSQAERGAQYTAQTGAPWGSENGYVPHQQAQPATGWAPPQNAPAPGAQTASPADGVTFTEAQYTTPQEPDYIRPEAPKDIFEAAEEPQEPQDVFADEQEAAEGVSAPQAQPTAPGGENAVQTPQGEDFENPPAETDPGKSEAPAQPQETAQNDAPAPEADAPANDGAKKPENAPDEPDETKE